MAKVKRKPVPYEENHKDIKGITHKLCSDCDEWFPQTTEYYYKNKSAPDGFNPYCKECTKKRSAKWTESNYDKWKESQRKTNKKPESIVKNRVRNQNWRDNGGLKEWQQNNPDRIKEFNKNREQHKKHEIGKIEWENCKKYFNHRCAYCGLKIEEHYIVFKGMTRLGDFHKEHVNHEGTNDLSNCVPSCKVCNTSKHNKQLEEWYYKQDFFTEERYKKILKWINEDYKKYLKTNIIKSKVLKGED